MSEKLIKNIDTAIEGAQHQRRANRIDAARVGEELIANTKSDFNDLREQNASDGQFKDVSDRLATEILQCGIDYFKSAKDSPDDPSDQVLALFNSAKKTTKDETILRRIAENVEGVEDWVINQTYKDSQFHIYDFDKILLQTAFSFMTCDGDIDRNEVALIRQIAKDKSLFGNVDIDIELEFLVEVINAKGMGFLKDYFKVLKNANLNKDQELQLVELALSTLRADGVEDYNELKFFRIFRTQLRVSDDEIKQRIPNFPDEYLEMDIFTNTYLEQLFDDYFDEFSVPQFDKSAVGEAGSFVDPDQYSREE